MGKKSGDSYVKATVVKQDDALYSEAIRYVKPELVSSDLEIYEPPDNAHSIVSVYDTLSDAIGYRSVELPAASSNEKTSLKQDNIERQTPRLEGLILRIVGTATTSVQVFSSKIMENCISKSS